MPFDPKQPAGYRPKKPSPKEHYHMTSMQELEQLRQPKEQTPQQANTSQIINMLGDIRALVVKVSDSITEYRLAQAKMTMDYREQFSLMNKERKENAATLEAILNVITAPGGAAPIDIDLLADKIASKLRTPIYRPLGELLNDKNEPIVSPTHPPSTIHHPIKHIIPNQDLQVMTPGGLRTIHDGNGDAASLKLPRRTRSDSIQSIIMEAMQPGSAYTQQEIFELVKGKDRVTDIQQVRNALYQAAFYGKITKASRGQYQLKTEEKNVLHTA